MPRGYRPVRVRAAPHRSSPHLPGGAVSCTPSSVLPDVLPGSDLLLEPGEEPSVPKDVSKERAKRISCQTLFRRRCSQVCSAWAGNPSPGGEEAGAAGTGRVGGSTGSPLPCGGLGTPGVGRGRFFGTGF